jgi:hypothetical protein
LGLLLLQGPCATPQAVMPVKWPKYEKDSKANLFLDLCNITIETDLKEDACVRNPLTSFTPSHAISRQHLTSASHAIHASISRHCLTSLSHIVCWV